MDWKKNEIYVRPFPGPGAKCRSPSAEAIGRNGLALGKALLQNASQPDHFAAYAPNTNENQSLGLLDSRELAQKDAVDKAEERRIRPDAQRQQNYGYGRNSRPSGQNALERITTHRNFPDHSRME
jgi:hypothetical protein